MTKRKSTKRALLLSALSLLMCVSMLIGSTFAWFTDSVTSNSNKIQAGTLDVQLLMHNGTDYVDISNSVDPIFGTAGLAQDSTNTLWEPGKTQVAYLAIKNNGNLALKYTVGLDVKNISKDLYKVMQYAITPDAKYDDVNTWKGAAGKHVIEGTQAVTDGYAVMNPGDVHYFALSIRMLEEAGNEYMGGKVDFDLTIIATQATVESDSFGKDYDKDAPKCTDTWDGTADTTWYNDTDTEFTLTSAEQLAGLAELVDGGNKFAGKTIKLDANMNLEFIPDGSTEPKSFDPIGDDSPFAGTFDGQGYAIKNLYQSGWAFGYEWGAYGSVGLFGELESATVKNVTISKAESFVEGGDVGGITGSATGTCVFENITLEDSVFATYNNGNGGIIGWSGAGNYTFKNITIKEDVSLAGLWGSFDSSIGGIVGQGEAGATYNFENVDIACRLDVYNDCTASYDYYNYRMCGMIIGRLQETTTIDGANYPDTSKYNIICNNVTVTYDDWANYHYCEPTPGHNNGRGMRVEPGYQYGGLPADYDHSQCVDNHMNLIPFDQVFGGAQIAVKGLKSYDGVTVIYNNK